MCCFSRSIEKVADTQIFARASATGKQYLVYSMFLSAKEELAMILPIPTPKGSAEDAVRFINLEKYPTFFADLRRAYPLPRSKGGAKKKDDAPPKAIKVVEVGSFLASFVPSVKDFARLDAHFQLPAGTWDDLPTYKEYGFTVFKLKPGAKVIHPMAFEFPRADPKRLFFPTVHIHDGNVHKTAMFDHALYCQRTGEDMMRWQESKRLAKVYVKIPATLGIVAPDAHLYRQVLRGRKTNQDTWLV